MPEVRIPIPSVPIIDQRTGHTSREWRWFFHQILQRIGGVGDITGLFTTDIGDTVQAYHAALASIAGLTTAADRMIYTTASNDYAVTALTTTGRALIDDANTAAQRTTLGLVIGTNVFTQRTITAADGAFWADGDGVSGNPTIDVALQVFEVTVGQAALGTGGEVILLDAAASETWKVMDIWYDGTGTDFAGGGGDRLLDITDGTSIWSAISAATLAGVNGNPARWGDADLPNPATDSHMFAASASGADIVAKYSGGATDYTAGSLTLRVTAYRTA